MPEILAEWRAVERALEGQSCPVTRAALEARRETLRSEYRAATVLTRAT